jgi:hypothetical protein
MGSQPTGSKSAESVQMKGQPIEEQLLWLGWTCKFPSLF